MAKLTLLEIVQDILSDMDSDDVNSITDTVEALQVAQVVKSTYYNIISLVKIPENKELFQLEALADVTKPNYMRVPDNVLNIEWFKYNALENGADLVNFTDVVYCKPEAFLNRIQSRNSTDSNVIVVTDFSGVPLLIRDDKTPEFYTSFDDEHIVTDSYDVTKDSTLQNSKSMTFAQLEPVFQIDNDYVPEIDSNYFPLLLAEAKSMCFVNFKQTANPAIEREVRRQNSRMQNDKHKLKEHLNNVPSYGRRGKKWITTSIPSHLRDGR